MYPLKFEPPVSTELVQLRVRVVVFKFKLQVRVGVDGGVVSGPDPETMGGVFPNGLEVLIFASELSENCTLPFSLLYQQFVNTKIKSRATIIDLKFPMNPPKHQCSTMQSPTK